MLGVVLLTDGRQNGPSDPLPTVRRLAARGIPIYPVLIGSTRPPRDAAIAAVKAPESVYKGDVATIAATLKLDGYAGRAVAVTLDRPGASPLRQVVDAPADGSRPVVTFRVPMDEVGHGPAHGRDRTPRRRRPARQRPPHRFGPGRRRQGPRPARRRRGAVGVPLPPQRPGPRPARRARSRRLPSAPEREHDHADLRRPHSRPGPKRQRPARTSPTRSGPSTSSSSATSIRPTSRPRPGPGSNPTSPSAAGRSS